MFFFGDEIKELNKMGRERNKDSNDPPLTFWIDGKLKYTTPGKPGFTIPLNDDKRAATAFNPVIFTDRRKFYVTAAHELRHARDILNGNLFLWTITYGSLTAQTIMEHLGYLVSAEIEAAFGVDYGSAESLQTLTKLLPDGFIYNNYNR